MSNKLLFNVIAALMISVIAFSVSIYDYPFDYNQSNVHQEIKTDFNDTQVSQGDREVVSQLNEQIDFIGGGWVLISWTMNTSHFASVEYGSTSAYGQNAQGPTGAETVFKFYLSNIADYENFYYKICVTPNSEGEGTTTECFTEFYENPNQVKAFPTAEGFGKDATGGRGGTVLKVTSLADNGVGTLREACNTVGTHTIVFEVGGTIDLETYLEIRGNKTILGQTAPGDGILVKGALTTLNESNAIIRYIRFRNGTVDETDSLGSAAWGSNTVENIIFDHCSISWADDESFNLRAVTSGTVRNVTLQYSIISESTYGVLCGPGTYNLTFYKNLLAHNQERNIAVNYPDDSHLKFEMINNLIYGFRWATSPALGSKFTVLNNKYKKSSQVAILGAAIEGTAAGQGTPSETYAYIDGNIVPTGMDEYHMNLNSYIEEITPFLSSGIIPIEASQIETDILSHVGCSFPTRDIVDSRIITQYNNGNGTLATSGTYPTISNGTPLTDTSGDGMPDTWKTSKGLDINTDHSTYLWASGYVGVEEYANELVGE